MKDSERRRLNDGTYIKRERRRLRHGTYIKIEMEK
jgi:hypothetical protein